MSKHPASKRITVKKTYEPDMNSMVKALQTLLEYDANAKTGQQADSADKDRRAVRHEETDWGRDRPA